MADELKAIQDVLKPDVRPERILQFGEGNFLRAFADWMIDIANEKTDFNGSAVLVQPVGERPAETLNAQKGLYTVVLRGLKNGALVEETRPITSAVSRCLNPNTQFDEYMDCAKNPALRFIISNTTEAGIAYNGEDRLSGRPQRSFPGKLCAFLYRRFEHFSGDPAKALIIIPCELIENNGGKLKEIVFRFAREWNLGNAFCSWLEKCDFCSSLVDRIVTGYPAEEAASLCEKAGYADKLLTAGELFHFWVIESEKDHGGEFPLAKAGLNVIWTKNLNFYRTRKVRILNGAHTSTVLPAFLYGLDTVEQCIKDPLVSAMMRKIIFEEIVPSMDAGSNELTAYANEVLERFANPYIKHSLLSISLNSVSKFRARLLPSLKDYFAKKGKLPPGICFSLASLIAFYRGVKFEGRGLRGIRNGEEYLIQDDGEVLDFFAALYAGTDAGAAALPSDGAEKIAASVLSRAAFWGEDLTKMPGLAGEVSACLGEILKGGVKKAMESLVDF